VVILLHKEVSHSKILRSGHKMPLCILRRSRNKTRLFLHKNKLSSFYSRDGVYSLRVLQWAFSYNSGESTNQILPSNKTLLFVTNLTSRVMRWMKLSIVLRHALYCNLLHPWNDAREFRLTAYFILRRLLNFEH